MANSPSAMRTTEERIETLAANEVFVFGSNTAGRHSAGAAKAAVKWGARYGQGHGMAGQTYAIATLDENLEQRPLEDIAHDVSEFISFARQHAHLTFLVTEIGCGLAGFSVEGIAPMFSPAVGVENIHLPERFWGVLEKQMNG